MFWKDISDDPAYGAYNYLVYFALNTLQETYEYEAGTCEDELLYDTDNSVRTIASDSYGYVYWEGGVPPYSVVTDGANIFVDAAKTTNEQYNVTGTSWKLYTGEVCEWCQVTITDSCGSSVDGDIYPTEGHWDAIAAVCNQFASCYRGEYATTQEYWQSLGLWSESGYIGATCVNNDFIATLGRYSWVDCSACGSVVGSLNNPMAFSRSSFACGLWKGYEDFEDYYYTPFPAEDTGLLIPAQQGWTPSGGERRYRWAKQYTPYRFNCT
jgi:hypothetical protein